MPQRFGAIPPEALWKPGGPQANRAGEGEGPPPYGPWDWWGRGVWTRPLDHTGLKMRETFEDSRSPVETPRKRVEFWSRLLRNAPKSQTLTLRISKSRILTFQTLKFLDCEESKTFESWDPNALNMCLRCVLWSRVSSACCVVRF